jgi:penicillin-binding protein 2
LFDTVLEKLKQLFSSRLLPIALIFVVFIGVLITRIFHLQIVEGNSFEESVSIKNEKTRTINSTRGNIYDRNGVLLAYNKLTYSVVLEDVTTFKDSAERNAMLHDLVLILEKYGNTIENEFPISLDESGVPYYNISGTALNIFKVNIYGHNAIDKLSKEEKAATAEEVFNYLKSGKKYNISDDYSIEEVLKIMTLRYAININFPKYNQILIVSDVDEKTVAAILENSYRLPGVDIKQQTSRVYNESLYTAHILGYTGLINATELETLNQEEEKYTQSDVVGKTGLEKQYEEYLVGTKGKELISVNSSNKYLETIKRTEPVAGNDLYLTIDLELSKAYYHIIERNLAGILLSKINNSPDAGTRGTSSRDIRIPIYDVYYALINNNVIDVNAFTKEDASDLEKQTYNKYLAKQAEVLSKLDTYLSISNTETNKNASEEMSEYLTHVYSILKTNKVLLTSEIDTTDEYYINYQNNKISLSKFLQYAIACNWIDLSKLNVGDEYYSTEELYEKLQVYIKEILKNDSTFHKKLYKDLVYSYKLTGSEICLLLFDQGVLEYNEEEIQKLKNGTISAYTFITGKIRDLSITPAQLALEPSSASVVVTDVNTGEVIAMVSYPSYDNNKFANKIDSTYFAKVNTDLTTPMVHRATKQLTAPGSTFKMVSAITGLEENAIGQSETIKDDLVFTKINPSPKCWSTHSHGYVDVTGALEVSCNYFFYELSWRLGQNGGGNNRDQVGLEKLAKYASLLGLDRKSGVEVDEAEPSLSSKDSVRTAIGQGNAIFSPVQLSRYVTTVANGGTLFELTLVDKIVDKDGKIILDNSAANEKLEEIKSSTWKLVQDGMYKVGHGSKSSSAKVIDAFPKEIAGKTGTAQINANHANHGLFVSYAPYDKPEISVTTVIPNGYSSGSAVALSLDLYSYYYGVGDKEELVNGDAALPNSGTSAFSD